MTSPEAQSTTAKNAPSVSFQATSVETTYSRASLSRYGLGSWWIQRAISASSHAAAIAGTSSSVHGRSETIPSERGGWGGRSSTWPRYKPPQSRRVRTIWPSTRLSRVSFFAPPERRRGVAMTIGAEGRIDLGEHGIDAGGRVHVHPSTSILYTHTLRRNEGRLAEGGPLVVDTGRHTGRSPMDKFIVREPGSKERIWWSTVNQELDEGHFEGLRDKVTSFLEHQDLYVVDSFAAADPAHRVGVRLITYSPWHALFAKTLFIEPT